MPRGKVSKLRPIAQACAGALLGQKRYAKLRTLALPADCDTVDRYLVGTHHELSSHEQAARLGVSRAIVQVWRGALTRRGLLDPTMRARNAPITDAEIQAVARLWSDGWSREGIAAQRETSPNRVRSVLLRAGVTPETPRRTRLTSPDVERLFGLPTGTLVRWRAYGWLPDYRPRARAGSPCTWDMDDLLALVRNRDSWVAWAPGQIADPQLRHLAEQERQSAGGAWHQLGEIADVLGLSLSALLRWADADDLFASLPRRRFMGARYHWLTTGQLAELEAWGVPVRQLRDRPGRHRIVAMALRRRLCAAYGHPEPLRAAAD